MTSIKPQIVYLSDKPELIELVRLKLSHTFEVTGVTDVADLDAALDVLRLIRPDYVLLDPHVPNLDHRQLHRRIKADEELNPIQILVIREDET